MRFLKSVVRFAALATIGVTTNAEAQTGAYPVGGGYAPGWNGYAPGYGWAGYNPQVFPPPAVVVRPAPAPTPTQARSGVATAPPIYRPGVAVPRSRMVNPPIATTRPTRSAREFKPAHYREFGTGRNVFMHKPWLPNQP